MAKHGKKFRTAAEKTAEKEQYTISEAIKLLKETSTTKFDSSCELHLNLGIDPTHADQLIRSTISLPHGSGKTVRVAAFVNDDMAKAAKAAGADKAGLEDLIEEVAGGKIDFDIAVATPDVMRHLGKIAKTLGTKGLMPNPKAGTVSPDIEKTIAEIKKGRLEYKTDKLGQIHQIFGKVSFAESALEENLRAFLKAIVEAKPSAVKGTFIKRISVATTMGPGINVDLAELGSL